MPPKVYVPAYPAGDFRAMPALGGGHALLKWVTSFPGNPAQGLPTVMGLVLLSDASNGSLRAAARRRRRDGAADRCGRGARGGDARPLGCGDCGRRRRGRERDRGGRTFLARGRDVAPLRRRSGTSASAPPASRALQQTVTTSVGLEQALAADLARDDHAGARGAAPGGLAPARPAREPDGRGRPGQGRDRRRRASAHRGSSPTTGSRRATTASSCTRSRPAGSSEAA